MKAKKNIIAAMAVFVALTVSAASKADIKSDSLAMALGATQGHYFEEKSAAEHDGKQLQQYRKEFLRGLHEAMLADTVNTGYRDGLSIGNLMLGEIMRMNQAGVSTNVDLFVKTFTQYYNGQEITEEELTTLKNLISEKLAPVQQYYEQKKVQEQEARVREYQQLVESNLEAGRRYIADLKAADPEYKTTASGLVYKVDRAGEGPNVQPSDRVRVYYTGRLVDGTQFDSTKPEAPATFHASQLIKGFTEGLLLMNKGAKYTLVIPPDIAYGEQAAPPTIGPGQTLVFEVEIVDIISE